MILVRAIKPKTKFRSSIFRDEMVAEATMMRDEIFSDFEKTVKTWKRKPVFIGGVSLGGGQIKVGVKTNDEIYGYVTNGTRPHRIFPKYARRLRFKAGFYAKTFPHVIGSVPGASFEPTVFSAGVQHPGTEAREFDETIYKKWKPEWARRMKNAMARATRKSGHGK